MFIKQLWLLHECYIGWPRYEDVKVMIASAWKYYDNICSDKSRSRGTGAFHVPSASCDKQNTEHYAIIMIDTNL